MRLLAIDPGETTGLSESPGSTWETKATHAGIIRILKQYRPSIIVCESINFANAQRGIEYYPIEIIGCIKSYAEEYDVELIEQNRSLKTYFDNDKIKKLGLWIPSKGHAMDALRHRLYYEMTHGMFDLKLLK